MFMRKNPTILFQDMFDWVELANSIGRGICSIKYQISYIYNRKDAKTTFVNFCPGNSSNLNLLTAIRYRCILGFPMMSCIGVWVNSKSLISPCLGVVLPGENAQFWIISSLLSRIILDIFEVDGT